MINKLSFGNAARYVNEGTIFTEKEVKQVAKKIDKALEQDGIYRLIRGEDKVHRFERPDAPIVPQIVEDKSVESYVLSHGGKAIAGQTLGIV